MTQTVTIRIQLVLSGDQKQILQETMSAYLDACNYISLYVFHTHKLSQTVLNKALYYNIRERFGLRSQMAQSAIRDVIARYKVLIASNRKWTRVRFRKPHYELLWNRDYSLKADKFSVNTVKGRIQVDYKLCDYLMPYFDKSKYQFGSATLVCRKGKYYLCVPVTYEISDCSTNDICNVVGIDRGVNFIATTYDSKGTTKFFDGRQIKQKRAYYKNLRRRLQRVRTPSSRRRLKAIGQRENRWMQDVNHQVSKALVEGNPVHTLFVLEELTGIRRHEKVRRKNSYEQVSWSFYDLEQKLKYKALRHGDMMVNVNPAYTSQTCPKCGYTHKDNRNKSKHLFICQRCGYSSNDDRTAAMNLHRMGIEYLVSDAVTIE